MDLAALKTLARRKLDDLVDPYLYSDADLTDYANEGVDEAALRARLILDSRTASVCSIALDPDATEPGNITLHGSIFVVRSARLRTAQSTLEVVTRDILEGNWCEWRTSTGTPEAICFDVDTGRAILAPIPVEVDTLDLTVWRRTLDTEKMVGDDDVPVINEIHHTGLIDWILHRCYEPKDGETGDDERSALHYNRFEARYGRRPDAHALKHMGQNRRIRITPHYY